MSKKKEEHGDRDQSENGDRGHELWGIVFLSLGLLVLISLISGFVDNAENVLGKYFGVDLSSGLVFLFGPVAAVSFPSGILFIGWKRLTGEKLRPGVLVFSGAVVIELCLLSGIKNLPIAAAGNFHCSDNYIGNGLTYALHYIFGPHRFGPYFLTIVALILTLCAGLKVPLTGASDLAKKLGALFAAGLKALISKVMHCIKSLPEKVKQGSAQNVKIAQPVAAESLPKQNSAAAEQSITPGITAIKTDMVKATALDPIELETQKRLEAELAAFRAKKDEPINITTMATPQEPEEIEEEPVVREEDIPDEFLAGGYAGGSVDLDGEAPLMKKPSAPSKPYRVPSHEILPEPPAVETLIDKSLILQNSSTLEKTLMNFGIEGKVFNVSSGPFVTRYEIELAPGVKVSRVVSLQDDISMAVGGQKIRIEAPIPGKAAIGIELPNPEKQIVYFKHILLSESFRKSKARLPMIIGQNISGIPYVTDITKMPHLLIAGQTGSGKSVCINSIICSLLMTKAPEEMRLILVDPKKVELAIYEGIPHLLSPVVTESKEAVKALHWATMEMDRRYRLLGKIEGTRNIESFNTRIAQKKYKEGILSEEEKKPLPFIVIVVDELADLMITASKDVETLIQRIAQLGRAAGVHLIVATQRPSVDIITGPIKANLAARVAFRTIQSTDSRTILGYIGAEKLLGMGDMLFLRSAAPDIERYHGAFISEEEVEIIVGDINKQNIEIEKIERFEHIVGDSQDDEEGFLNEEGRDALFEEAARMIVSLGQGSTSLLQRRMKIGYARAGRLMDELERAGIVGPQEGSKMREVLMKTPELEELLMKLRS
jgi:DNA segregation ATPase FtsK/SpoIIIE-like protein